MSRRAKVVLVVVLGVVGILIAAVLAAHHIVSRQDNQFIRQQLEARILSATGFTVQVHGPLEVPYSLLPTVVLRDIVLNNPDYVGERNLLEADELRFRFAVIPLLKGEVVIYESSLSNVELNLEVSEDGDENWITRGSGGASTTLPTQVAVHTVDLRDLSISHRNLETGTEFQGYIDDINIRAPLFNDQIEVAIRAKHAGAPIEVSGRLGSSEDILSGNAFPIDLEVDVYDVDIDVSGRIERIEEGEFSDLLLQLDVQGGDLRELEGLVGQALPATKRFSATTKLSLNDESIVASNLFAEIAWLDSELELAGDMADIEDLTGINMTVTISGKDLREISAVHDLAWLPATDAYDLSGTVRGSWPLLEVTEAQVHLEQNDIVVDAAGAVTDIADLGGFDVEVSVRGQDLRDWTGIAEFAWPQTRAYQLSGRLNGSWPAFSFSAGQAVLQRHDVRVELSGDIAEVHDLSGLNLGLQVSGENLAELSTLLGLDMPPTYSYRMSAKLTGDAENLAANNVRVDGEIPGATLDFQGNVGRISDLHDVDLVMHAATQDMSGLNRYVNFRLPATEPVEVSGRLRGSAPDLSLEDFTLISGESLVMGSAGIRVGDRLSIEGSVSSGVLDLRPYLIAAREEQEVETGSRSDRLFSDKPIDLSFLDHFDARIRLDNLEFLSSATNVRVDQATITLQEGSLSVDPLQLTRNDATFTGHFRLEKKAVPHYQLDMSIENMDLATFLKDIRIQEIYEGRFDLALDLESAGTSMRELAANLDGNVAAFVSEARIPQVSSALRTVDLVFELLPWIKRRKDITVNCAISQVEIKKGLASVNLLYVDAAQMTLIGGGTVNLQDERLNLRFAPRPKKRKFLAHNIDLTMKGSLAEPRLASAGAAKSAATVYGKYALMGPLGLLVPTSWSKSHPCVGSLQEFRQQQAEAE